jgi:hypothetical protein
MNYIFRAIGRRDEGILQPSARRVVENYGDVTISNMFIYRKPIYSTISYLGNIITLGKLSAAMKGMNYDNLFHLYMILRLNSGTLVIIQKNEVIDVSIITPERLINDRDYEYKEVSLLLRPDLTIKKLLDNTKLAMGPKLYTAYDARDNNCQVFILMILKSNDLLTPELSNFIYQDIKKIFSQAGYDHNPTSLFTDLAARFNVIYHGRGFKRRLKFE